MRGASRASLADAKERLLVLATRTSDAGQLGGELFEVVDLLDGPPPLRRALADSSGARSARSGLLTTVLGGNVSPDTAELLDSVVTSQWSTPTDLVEAIEELAVLAIVAQADQAGRLDSLEDDLFRFARVVGSSAELRSALGNPFAPAAAKQEMISALLDGKATPEAVQLVTQASLHPRGRSLDYSLAHYADLAAEQRERLVAEVRVATDLSAAQRGRLTAVLARAYGHEVHLNLVLDPQVIGGMIIRIGGEQIDGSVASRLSEARRSLAS
jgi:F-type H+-transporting ATPase subunit delta